MTLRIFLIGLTSSKLGGMEYANLGNYVIMEPFIQKLHSTFPDAEIRTSIQMSNEFTQKYKITCLRNKRFWSYGYYTAFQTAMDYLKVSIWKMFYKVGVKMPTIINSSKLLTEIYNADLVIDFSGDIYGDNATWNKFLESNSRLFFCRMLGRKTAMVIGSLGPFKNRWRQIVAKSILKNLDLLTTREPISIDIIKEIGVEGNHIHSSACPSVFFQKDSSNETSKLIEQEHILHKGKATVGIIICGWNMPEGPYNKWPRRTEEYRNFIALIKYLIDRMGVRVCLMSHQNGVTADLKLRKGNDHKIIDEILNLLKDDYDSEDLFTLKHFYNAAQSKTIIGQFDMLMSGRIHGAVQGLSQHVPTAIIEYGHEPKAHKLRGFAKVYGVEEYVCNPADEQEMIQVASKLWEDREQVKKHLHFQIPKVQELAQYTFKLLHQLANKEE